MRVPWLLSIRHGARTVVAFAGGAQSRPIGAPLQDQPDIAADEAADEAEARLPQLHRVPLAALTDILAEGLADALFAIRSGPSMELPAVTARVTKRMSEHRALKDLVELYPWLPTLLASVLRNQLRRATPVTSTLAELTSTDAESIGDGLTAKLALSRNAERAVHQWVLLTPAMSEMQLQHSWFTPFMERIAEQLFVKVGWHVQLRVWICGLLTYFDVASDITVICQYFANGQLAAAQISLGLIGYNFALQSLYGLLRLLVLLAVRSLIPCACMQALRRAEHPQPQANASRGGLYAHVFQAVARGPPDRPRREAEAVSDRLAAHGE